MSKLNELIKELKVSIEEVSVYDLNVYSAIELYYNVATKLNEVIREFLKLENVTTTSLEYLLNEGLGLEVKAKLMDMWENGILKEVLSDDILGDIYEKISLKADSTSVWNMSNLGQDVKEAITGGSVAVVGKNAVQKINVVDNQITVDKANFIKSGFNLVYPADNINGYLTSDGSIISSTTYSTTDFIKIKSGDTKLTLTRNTGGNASIREIRFVCFYDSNYNALSSSFYDNSSNAKQSVDIPSGARYLRATYLTGYNDSNSCLHFGDENRYKVYENIIRFLWFDNKTLSRLMDYLTNSFNNQASLSYGATNYLINTSNNMLDTFTMKDGYLDGLDVLKNPSPSKYYTSNYIDVHNKECLSLWGNSGNDIVIKNIRIVNFYDEQKQHLNTLRYDNEANTAESVIIPTGAYFARISIASEYRVNTMLTLTSEKPSKIEPFKIVNIYEGENKSSNLNGKTIFNFGDSIAAGDGNNGKGYAEILASKYSMTCFDYAVGGATLGETSSNNISTQVNKAISSNVKPDFILINGGTNDINNNAIVELGTISSSFNKDTFNRNTTVGSLEYLLSTLKTNYPNSKIAFISVHKMNTRDYNKQIERQSKCLEVCNKWSVPVVDVFNKGNLNTFIDEHAKYTNPTSTKPKGDRTHPNQEGYEKFYIPLIEHTLNKIS